MEMKCIDKILLEWSAESDDGLLSGYNSLHNIACLKRLLSEYKVSEHLHGEIISEILATEVQPRSRVVPPTQTEPEDLTNKTIWEKMVLVKKMNPAGIEILKAATDQYDKDGSFLSLYDTCENFDDAAKIYADQRYSNIVDATNKFEYKGLGRGEIIFVYLLKDCRSGGTTDADLVMLDGRKVDVKESTAETIKLSVASVKGFTNLKWYIAVQQLITFLRKNSPDAGNFLLSVLKDETIYKVNRPAGAAEIQKFSEFVGHLNAGEMNGSVFTALELLSYKLDADKSKSSGTIDIKIDDKEKTLVVNNPDQVGAVLDKPQRQNLNVDVSPILDKVKEFLSPEVKNLTYFKNKYDRNKITDEIIPHLHFKDGIVVVNAKAGSNSATYISGHDFGKKLKFVNLTFGALKLRVLP